MKNILVVSPTPTHPQNFGNRIRIFTFLKNLKQLGYKIYFLYCERSKNYNEKDMKDEWEELYICKRKTNLFKKIKVIFKKHILKKRDNLGNIEIDKYYNNSFLSIITKLKKNMNFQYILVEYIYLSKAFKYFDNSTIKILDTHDVFTDRARLFNKFNMINNFFSTTKEEEKKGINRADIVIAIQNKEKEYFEKLCPGKKVITVGHIVKLKKLNHNNINNRILFIGANNLINKDALDYYLSKIHPILIKRNSSLILDIVGNINSYYNKKIKNCNFLGTKPDIEEYYEQSDIVINPVRFGTGLKIKNIEALGYAKPLITTSVGAHGLENGINKAFIIADKPDQFAVKLLSLLKNKNKLKEISKAAYIYAERYNTDQFNNFKNIFP